MGSSPLEDPAGRRGAALLVSGHGQVPFDEHEKTIDIFFACEELGMRFEPPMSAMAVLESC
jgi:hypothetical protein